MDTMQGTAQLPAYFAETEPVRSLPGNNGKIGREKQAFVLPVKFPDQSLDAVSDDRVTHLSAYGYPKADG